MGTWILHSIACVCRLSTVDSKDPHNVKKIQMIWAWYTSPVHPDAVISSGFQVIETHNRSYCSDQMSLFENKVQQNPFLDHHVYIFRHPPNETSVLDWEIEKASMTCFDLRHPVAAGRHEIARRIVFFSQYGTIGHCFKHLVFLVAARMHHPVCSAGEIGKLHVWRNVNGQSDDLWTHLKHSWSIFTRALEVP